MMKPVRILLPALLAFPMAAQDSPFSVNGAVIAGLDSLKKATNATFGATLGADYDTIIWGTDVPARVGLSVADLPGKAKFGLTTSLIQYQAHGDVLLDTAWPRLRWILGWSFNLYSMSRSGVEDTADDYDVDHHFPVRDVRGLKLGFRAGLTYAFTKRVSGDLLFQQTELAGKDLTDPLIRQGGINPAWFQLGVTYRF